MTDRGNMGEPNGPEQFGSEQTRSRISDVGSKVREKAGELGNSAKEAVNQGRQSAANALDSAGSRLHETADRAIPGGARVSTIAHNTADKLQQAAHYVRENDIMNDLTQVVRRYPTQSVFAAIAIGFLVGRGIRHD